MSRDLRIANWREVRANITKNRLVIYEELLRHGPCTCSELAKKINWAVTSVRPRVTELRSHFHAVTTGQRREGEYEFRALTIAEAQAACEAAERARTRSFHPASQLPLL